MYLGIGDKDRSTTQSKEPQNIMKIYLRQKFLKSMQASCPLVIPPCNQNIYMKEGLLEDVGLELNLKKALGREAREVSKRGNSFNDY